MAIALIARAMIWSALKSDLIPQLRMNEQRWHTALRSLKSISTSYEVAPLRPPSFATVESAPSLGDRFKSALDVEEMLGTNWLNKLGIVILVLGVAFFLPTNSRRSVP